MVKPIVIRGSHEKPRALMIKKVFIQNYKIFRNFDLNLNDGLTILVGDNEVGKSSILEAINLALTRRLNGKQAEQELTPYLFNQDCADEYLQSINAGTPMEPPPIRIELYLKADPELEYLRGSMNSKKEDCPGLKLEILFDDDFAEEYETLLNGPDKLNLVPAEFYRVHWYSFANNAITQRRLPLRPSYIDTTTIRLQSGTDYYLQDIIRSNLDPKERAGLSVSYRKLKELFSAEPGIQAINEKLVSQKGAITDKKLSISIDISQRANWETNLIPHLDELPFHQAGKGEQNALKVLLALDRKAEESKIKIILIEEPENHLSYSSMNILVSKIRDKCADKQVIITTHSAYVLNKLGLESLVLLSNTTDISTTTLNQLSPDTQDYFEKLSGYDTLRLVLAKKAILVEGPSDELIVQKAFLAKHNVLPIMKGVDVISVRGLSFLRFLEIAELLKKETIVVTDNDGYYDKKVKEKYKAYEQSKTIRILVSEDNNLSTLELHIVDRNELELLNRVFGVSLSSKEDMQKYMLEKKTECALKVFETNEPVVFPTYIQRAVR